MSCQNHCENSAGSPSKSKHIHQLQSQDMTRMNELLRHAEFHDRRGKELEEQVKLTKQARDEHLTLSASMKLEAMQILFGDGKISGVY